MTLKTILLRTLPFSLLTSPLMAQDIGKLFVLSEDVRDIVIKMPETQDLQSGKYLLSQREADIVKNLSSMDESVNNFLNNEQKIDCYTQQGNAAKILNNRIPYRNFNLYFTMTGTTDNLNLNSLGVLTTNDYERYLFDRMSAGYNGASNFYTFSELEQAFKNAYPNVNYDSLNFSEKEKNLSNYLGQLYGTKPPAGALVQVLAYNSMVSDGSNWKKYLGEANGLLTTDQKITLVSEFGNKFGSLYNYTRADTAANDTFVTMENLLYSAKTGTAGGICRDIALAQTQMLQELGFDKSYMISYKTADSAHATVISQDPTTGKIIKFNYGEVSESDKTAGTGALNMNNSIPDHTLFYRIYDHNAKAVTAIPSQLTQVLRDATNYKDKMYFDKRYQLGKVGFESPDGRLGGNFFSGKTSAGEQINGAAFYYKMTRPYVNTDLGFAYASSEKENDYYYVKTNELYGRFHNEIYSPSYNINNTKTEAFVGSNVDVAMANNTDMAQKGTYYVKGKYQLEAHNSYEAGVRTEGKLSDGKTSFNGEIFATSYIDFAHAAKQNQTALIYGGTVIRAGAQQQITPDMVVLADSSVLIRRYGTSLVTTAGVENTKEKYKFYVGAKTPLTGDIPDFLPGSEKVVFLGGEKESAKGYYVKFDLEKNISNPDTSANLKVGKKF